jgi:2-oxoisovalerate dehydrogenase E2 component (dihydrolipoyl transacylase)
MGSYIIKTPDIGEGIAEVELVAWHVQVGDKVSLDQVVADVMTEKATVEIPSPVAGTVLSLSCAVGQAISVGAELIRLEVQGAGNVKDSAVAAGPIAPLPEGATKDPRHCEERSDVAVHAVKPVIAKSLAAAAIGLPRSARNDETPVQSDEKPIASPALRRRAWELGIDLARVQGTGSAGRILHADLDAYAAAHPSAPPAPRAAAAVARPDAYAKVETQQTIPVIGLRRRIALKMQDAKRRIPHFTYVEEVDVSELEALRERLNAQWGAQRGRLTVLPLLARAMVLALREFPQINARFDDDVGVVTRFGGVHLGIATQTDNGLMVPVLRHVESRDLWSCAAEISRLAEVARSGRATREELSGSTITLTSLGALGGIVSTPVINHPEVAIVGVNRMVERPMVRGGAVVIRKMMNLSSSFDHRVVDGLDAAKFIQAVRGFLEAPATLFID